MLRRIALAALAALLVGAADAPGATPHTIRTSDGRITRIGPLRTTGVDGGTVARAIRAFGPPSVLARLGGAGSSACRAEWRRLRFRATFANFGGSDPCGSDGRLQQATIRSRRFRTTRDLRVGDRSSSIRRKHPAAEFHRTTWWITSVVSPFGEAGTRIPTIEAIVQDGRVRILRLWVGAAGD